MNPYEKLAVPKLISPQEQPMEMKGLDAIKKEGVINALIENAPPVSPIDRSVAPFKNFQGNNDELWNYVPHQEVTDYLATKFFFETGTIEYEDMTPICCLVKYTNEPKITIPLDLVVKAAGFDDWRGRDPRIAKSWSSKYGDGEGKSVDVIKHYAGLSSELPPVGSMRMFIQPNGKIFFDNGGGDSHRIAAAILRGQETIETRIVDVYQLKKDYIY